MTALVRTISRRLPRDKRKEQRVLKTALAATVLAPFAAAVGGAAMGAVIPILVFVVDVLVIVYVRRLPRLVISGLVGGGIVGLLALGAGSRLAMRIVSLTGGRREVTIEGTMFLLIAGAMFGAMVGLMIAASLRVWPGSERRIALTVGALLVIGLTLDSEVFDELLHDGVGGWLNFPMFLSLPFLFTLSAVRLIARIGRRLPGLGNRSTRIDAMYEDARINRSRNA